jgi:signal transduction histidine kinase
VDPEKAQQIVLNLLSNAIKFTDAGGSVGIECCVVDDRVRIQVNDTGCGIPDEYRERVFHPFVQVDVGLSRRQEGTGLGLAISRNLARGMGGELTVESIPDVGSTFVLTLPATAAPADTLAGGPAGTSGS